jgi:hypothetical protein
MKKIVLLSFLALLLCGFAGWVVSFSYHHHCWVGLLFMAIPLLFGYRLLSNLFLRIDKNNLKKVTILNAALFLVMIGLLIIAAYCRIDEKSLFGMAYAGGIFSYILGLVVVGIGLTKRWENRKKSEKEYLY